MRAPISNRLLMVSMPLVLTMTLAPTAAHSGVNQTLAKADALKEHLEHVLDLTRRRYLIAGRHTPWQIFHGILAFGRDFMIKGPDDRVIPAIDYVCRHATLDDQRIFQPTRYGLRVLSSGATEGHPDQFLAVFAMNNVPIDYPIIVGDLQYQVHHLVTQAQYDYYWGREASWTLIALSTYLSPDTRWRNKYNDVVSVEQIVRYEVSLPPDGAPCAGTHNLYALAHALREAERKSKGTELTGVWQAARDKLHRYVQLTRQLQSSDGSFVAAFRRHALSADDPEDVMYATGHTLEWLVLFLPEDELQSRWIEQAVERLLTAFDVTATDPVRCGPLYHAAHALRLYYERRFGRWTQSTEPALPAGQ